MLLFFEIALFDLFVLRFSMFPSDDTLRGSQDAVTAMRKANDPAFAAGTDGVADAAESELVHPDGCGSS